MSKQIKEISELCEIQFGVLSPEEIKKRSVVNIFEQQLYDSNGPKLNALFDPRMGVIERNKRCKTCLQDYIECPGHFGHIELAKPIYNSLFIDQIKKILKCVCNSCSKLLIDKDNELVKDIIKTKKARDRLTLISAMTPKSSVCGIETTDKSGENTNKGCGAKQPKQFNSKDTDYIIAEIHQTKSTDTGKHIEKTNITYSAEIVLNIFKRISN